MLTIEFRIYSRATKGGGAVIKSTASGGGTTATSNSGGGVAKSTESGGATTRTSSGAINWMDGIPAMFTGTEIEETDGTHYHLIPGISNLGNHTHSLQIPSHTHSFNIPNHTHSVNIPDHSHEFNIPNHTHEVEHGIFTLDRMPTAVTIKVDGNVVPHTALTGENIDLIPYLALDSENRVERGWHTVEITPNDLGRITAQVHTQFFIQSRGGVDV